MTFNQVLLERRIFYNDKSQFITNVSATNNRASNNMRPKLIQLKENYTNSVHLYLIINTVGFKSTVLPFFSVYPIFHLLLLFNLLLEWQTRWENKSGNTTDFSDTITHLDLIQFIEQNIQMQNMFFSTHMLYTLGQAMHVCKATK